MLLQFFGDGEHWLQGNFREGRQRRCLVDAIAYLRRKHHRRITCDAATPYLIDALASVSLPPAWARTAQSAYLIHFNDHCCKSFDDLRAVLIKARSRAAQDFCAAAAQREIESQPAFIAAKAAALQKRQTAAANKRQLLAEIERERMARSAAGETRKTYTLCPRAPEPEPERLAA